MRVPGWCEVCQKAGYARVTEEGRHIGVGSRGAFGGICDDCEVPHLFMLRGTGTVEDFNWPG